MSTTNATTGTPTIRRGMADMLKGGVIMDVVTPEQARIGHFVEAQVLHAPHRLAERG